MTRFKDLRGKVFGRLTAEMIVGKDQFNKTLWQCLCECGVVAQVPVSSLLTGNTKSCGCMKSIAFQVLASQRKASAFGIHHVRAQSSWRHMIDRCTKPTNKHFADYGGRGIKVCERWLILRNFVADMGDPPDGMTLDRWPDMNGNYEPGNCRWATPKQQAQNTRRNVYAMLGKDRLCLADIADRLRIKRPTLYSRYAAAMKKVELRIGQSTQNALAE